MGNLTETFSDIVEKIEKKRESERDEIDTQSRIELKKYDERLKFLESYEQKRSNSKQFSIFNKSQSSAINKHREGILLSLSYELRDTSKLLLDMQETRLSRKRDVDLGNFDPKISSINAESFNIDLIPEIPNNENEFNQLSQEQLQTLQQENSEILDAKLEDLAKVEQISKSVIEIAQLESQLGAHLTIQSENIQNLVNEHDLTEIDIVEGNKILKKAKGKGNYASKIVMFTAITLGSIILFYDFIAW
ncbi:Syntaxin [Wickerhamomyces ciferrii]|uniref:Syntaxin n=1 Tax=Wickerhamomyces ciferrii (strain ATCC 14091 / BCRC 22168 / CBS 111 / JCM 3599 / NBRC 0793 / NRRL Y-1031 F-60-10) TaxID=1206466 RepID=K0KK32_WICCF|nr:Syntaxin [Wickerhamomyces ciferrii]CCH43261.1 Syntaxin [Wickerhamomyces ciferrii]